MTESDIWNRIKGWLTGYSVRIENSLSGGLSDVLWCPLGLSVFLELKVRDGAVIYIRNSQVVFGLHASKSVPYYQHMFVIGSVANRFLSCYHYATIMRCHSVVVEPGKQKFYIENAKPDWVWSGGKDVSGYVEFLEKAQRNGTVGGLSSESERASYSK